MLKRLLTLMSLSLAFLWAANAVAETVGFVDMRQVFETPQVKDISNNLEKQFSSDRQKMATITQAMQDNVNKFQKEEPVLSKQDADNLKATIQKQGEELQKARQDYQTKLLAAQNKAMNDFMAKLKSVAGMVAQKNEVDLVLPKDMVLYAKDNKDLTPQVVSGLR